MKRIKVIKIKEGRGNEDQMDGREKNQWSQKRRQAVRSKHGERRQVRTEDWHRGGMRKIKKKGERVWRGGRKWGTNVINSEEAGGRECESKNRVVEKNEGWREGGRDGEPLIIYDSLSFSKQPSGPAPCFPLTFNLSENQWAWSLIIVSVCQRLRFNLPDTEVRSQAVLYTHVSWHSRG